MRKIMTVVGTRPELIKMSLVMARLDKLTNHVLVHTGQNYDYELNQVFFDDLDLRRPDYFLNAAGKGPIETIAQVMTSVDQVLAIEAPEAVLIYGDTNSGLSVIPAKRRKIPVFHMEAGNRCFDQRVPEELNRKIIDHLSDVNMTLTEHARRYLLAEGLSPEVTFKVGSHLAEVLSHSSQKINLSTILDTLGVEPGRYILVSAHREENVDHPGRLGDLVTCLESLAKEFDFPIIMSTHPRTRARLDAAAASTSSTKIQFLPPFAFTDYVKLQKSAYVVLSDSGTITEEAALLDLPAVNLRESHERPEGMDAGTVMMSSLKPESLFVAIRAARDGIGSRLAGRVLDYEVEDVSAKVVRIVLSYIDYVNRVVWSKS